MRSSALSFLPLTAPARAASRAAWVVVIVLMIVTIAAADYWTGYEVSLFVLYLGPVFVATWMLGLWPGIATAAAATLVWYFLFAAAHTLPHPLHHVWDAGIRGSTIAVFAVLIHRLKLALARSDERFVTVLEGLNAAVYGSDARTRELLYVNERCRTAFGPPAPRYLAEVEARFAPENPETHTGSGRASQREAHDPATSRWYLLDVRPMRWVDGREVALHVATDVTQRHEAEQLARDQRQKLETSSRLIAAGQMAATLAHELNHPLAAVLNYNTGCLSMLESGAWDEAQVRDGLEKSSGEAERAGRIIRQVREFIRTREPALVACSAPEVVETALKLIEDEAARADTRVTFERAAQPCKVHADPIMLQALVVNLVRNAIEATQEADASPRAVVIRSVEEEGVFRLEVEDRGPGLPQTLEKELFTPFFSTKPGGMGLGLQICRSIAEFHEGRLWATPRAGGGTVFHFSLPLHAT